jgi:low affinity Fe/Cu permease
MPARDAEATKVKLDALLHAIENADRRYIAFEEMTHQEIQMFRDEHGSDRGQRSAQGTARSPEI